MVDAAATPQTVPMERKRYTIEVETACSTETENSASIYLKFSHLQEKRYVRDCSKAAMFVNRILGYTIPWPILAGKRYATYFHDASWYFSDATSPFPNIMRKQPSRTRWPSIPHRDIRKPAMRPPIGVAIEGMMSRTPAFDAESRSTTWKNRGIMNRNYLPC
jgi:hypothetical protein